MEDNLSQSHFNNRLITTRNRPHVIQKYYSMSNEVKCACGFTGSTKNYYAHLRSVGRKPAY